MLHKLLGDTSFHDLLLKIDEEVAQEVRKKRCPHCGGVLHSARYERKPRGGPSELPADYDRRASFCCATAGCRKRVTPAALRFWGRRVYLGPVFLLVFSLQSGITHKRTEELRKQLQAPTLSRHTLKRWRQWWLEVFPGTSFWRAGRARFAPPVDEKSLPGALLARFGQTDAAERVVAALRYLAPVTAGAGSLMAP